MAETAKGEVDSRNNDEVSDPHDRAEPAVDREGEAEVGQQVRTVLERMAQRSCDAAEVRTDVRDRRGHQERDKSNVPIEKGAER